MNRNLKLRCDHGVNPITQIMHVNSSYVTIPLLKPD